MSLWAIIPVKPLKRGKSRLSNILSEEERTTLNRTMLINTLKALTMVEQIDTVLVVSRDPCALSIAREYSARTVQEDGNPELNTALRRAASVAKTYHANELLVLPADLPLITPDLIKEFVSLGGHPPEVIVAPDRRNDGTNALYINPIELIDFCYGPGSFEIHKSKAKHAGANLQIYNSELFGLDLDLPEDLDELKRLEKIQNNH